MKNKLTIDLSSNLDYEGMVVDINYNMTTIASINYDKGIDKIEIEFFPLELQNQKMALPLEDFIEVVEKAKQIAIKCAKEFRELDT
jgi:hypothetical protein